MPINALKINWVLRVLLHNCNCNTRHDDFHALHTAHVGKDDVFSINFRSEILLCAIKWIRLKHLCAHVTSSRAHERTAFYYQKHMFWYDLSSFDYSFNNKYIQFCDERCRRMSMYCVSVLKFEWIINERFPVYTSHSFHAVRLFSFWLFHIPKQIWKRIVTSKW